VAVPTELLSLLAALVLGAACFAAMGIGVTGLVRTAEGSSAVINAIFLPVAIISGTFFTPKSYPEFLRVIALILPLTHYTELVRNVMLHGEHIWSDTTAVTVVLAWGLVGLVGALRGFRWQPVES
jgi:ABC-2 type transport system permease protein